MGKYDYKYSQSMNRQTQVSSVMRFYLWSVVLTGYYMTQVRGCQRPQKDGKGNAINIFTQMSYKCKS